MILLGSREDYYVSYNMSIDYEGKKYDVRNFDYVKRGRISLVDAMAESDNSIFVQLALDLSLKNVAETARDMDLTTPADPSRRLLRA
jgi:membrane peptidoglycan carboxypeptidase